MDLAAFNPKDRDEVETLFKKVFTDSAGQSEGLLTSKLAHDLVEYTASEDLYGFVAMQAGQIVGGIFFSRLTFDSKINAFILSPVAVQTDCQNQGIGQKLICFGINHLKNDGVERIFTYGDPNFYRKVGFEAISTDIAKPPLALTYPIGWLCQSLTGDEIESIVGESHCVAALNHPEYW